MFIVSGGGRLHGAAYEVPVEVCDRVTSWPHWGRDGHVQRCFCYIAGLGRWVWSVELGGLDMGHKFQNLPLGHYLNFTRAYTALSLLHSLSRALTLVNGARGVDKFFMS